MRPDWSALKARISNRLARHFGHKLDVEFDETHAVLPFSAGRAELRAEDGILTIAVEFATTPK